MTLVVGAVGLARRVEQRSTPPATASTPPRCPPPRPASPGSTPSPTRASPSSPAAPGGAFEKAWQASDAAVDGRAQPSSAQNPASSDLSPLPVVRRTPRSTSRSARSTTAATGTARSRSRRAPGPGSGNATFAAFDTSSGRAAGRPERPDRAAARRRRRLAAARRGALGLLAGSARGRLRLVGRLAATGGVPMSRRRRARSPSSPCWPSAWCSAAARRRASTTPTPAAHADRHGDTATDRAPRPAPPRPRRPAPTSSPTNCLQSYAPAGHPAGPGPDAGRQLHGHDPEARPAHRRASRPTPCCSAPATRSPGRSRASTSTCCTRSRRRSSATPTRSSCGSSPRPSACRSSRTAASTSSRAT